MINNPTQRNETILQAVDLIDKELTVFVNKYKIRKFMSEDDIQDMRSGCILEIIQAIDRFDPSKEIRLITFISPRINGYFKDFLKKENKLKFISTTDMVELISPQIDHVFEFNRETVEVKLDDIKLDNYTLENIYLDISKFDREVSDHLVDCIISMPDVRSYVILSYYILDNSIKEISEELGVSYNAGWVYKLKRKSIEMLRKKLKTKGVQL